MSMNTMIKKGFCLVFAFCLPLSILALDLNDLRLNWYNELTGYPYDPEVIEIKNKITSLTSAGKKQWDAMIKDSGRSRLWNDLSYGSSADITESYDRLQSMALAYNLDGSDLYRNEQLKSDILSALEWMYMNQYNESTNDSGQNWWDYKIGAPLRLNNVIVLMYDNMPPDLRNKYLLPVFHFCPDVGHYTGANLVWIATVIAVRGIISGNETDVIYARNSLNPLFDYVTQGDGFYEDGSFIQHERHPYTGGYGTSLLATLTDLMTLYHGSSIDFSEENRNVVSEWIWRAFEPLVFRGGMMSMVRGREIARSATTDHKRGRSLVQILMRLRYLLPEESSLRIASLVKDWLISDKIFSDYYAYMNSIRAIKETKALIENTDIPVREVYEVYRQFPCMDRAVQHRPTYAVGISMYSSRIYNYENTNRENIRGWHNADGAIYLYTPDQNHYEGNFWATVNPYRISGTTVAENSTAKAKTLSEKSWVGGVGISGKYGCSGMFYESKDPVVSAKKSWFMFDDELVALGAGITNKSQVNVCTYIDQRKLVSDNRNVFTVDGVKQNALFGSDTAPLNLTGVTWAHLSGKYSGMEVGYYFPEFMDLKAIRQQQTGSWRDINEGGSTAVQKDYYLTLWKEHGNCSDDTDSDENRYSYVLIPSCTTSQLKNYCSDPDIKILSNTSSVQAVMEKTLGIIGANFWNNSTSQYVAVDGVPFLYCDKKASVMVREGKNEIEVSVSDPTMLNTDEIMIRLVSLAAGSIIRKDERVTVLSYEPLVLSFNVKDLSGRGLNAVFQKKELSSVERIQTDTVSFDLKYVSEKGDINLSVYSPKEQKALFRVTDMNGRLFVERELSLVSGMENYYLPSKFFSSGCYLLSLILSDRVISKKFIR